MTQSPLMKREKVEHILRAAGRVTGKKVFVLIGSAAIVAWREMIPPELAISRDVDLFAYDTPDVDEIADSLDGALGQASAFDQTFGYYCDGVGADTALLPTDWRDRALTFSTPNTEGVTALVPEPNDIALSKLFAWRPKDIDWLRVAVATRIIDPDTMRDRSVAMPASANRPALLARIDALAVTPSP